MTKKVGFLIMNMQNVGGTERVTSIIANELSQRDYKISIISCREGEYSKFFLEPEINLYSLHGEEINHSLFRKGIVFQRLRKIVRDENINVMVAVDVALYIYLLPLQKMGYCKAIAWEHFNYFIAVDFMAKTGRKLAAKYADSVIVLGKTDLENYKRHFKKIKHIECIYNPLVLKTEKKADLSKKNIISVGRSEPEKGFDLLIKVWSKIENVRKDWTLNIYGDGKLHRELQQLITENKLTNIHLCGYAEDVEEKYLEASIFALSSRYEGFGLVLIEAQAKGLPCVSFNCKEGPGEIIDDGVNGFLIEEGNIDQYVEKLLMLMDDLELRKAFSEKASKDFEKYDITNITAKWEKILQI